MNTNVATANGGGELSLFNPDKALKTVVVSEAAEKHWARAKNPDKLFDAINAKITAQAEYVCWRDTKVTPSRKSGAPGRGKRVSGPKPVLPEGDPGALTAHRWRRSFCHKGETGTIIDKEKFGLALADAKHRALRIIEREANVRGTTGTGENEWYTPPDIIEAARLVLGGIDVDPASSDHAQKTIRALKYFTSERSGLDQEWKGQVWLNPPYAQPHIEHFADKMIAEVEAGRVTTAIMLTHNYTDTAWFQKLAVVASAICFTRGRVRFISPTGELASPTQGQALFFFGEDPAKFVELFSVLGFVVGRCHE